MRIKERRRPEAWRLRIYIDAIKAAEATTDAAWMEEWAQHCTEDSVYMTRLTWLSILRTWALAEADRLTTNEAA